MELLILLSLVCSSKKTIFTVRLKHGLSLHALGQMWVLNQVHMEVKVEHLTKL